MIPGSHRLARPVAVSDGVRVYLGAPGDEPPEWAAHRLTSPIVWQRPTPAWCLLGCPTDLDLEGEERCVDCGDRLDPDHVCWLTTAEWDRLRGVV